MSETTKEICVVHLVRAQNGIEPFKRFLDSYRANPTGIEHNLLVVFKGFARLQDTAAYRELLTSFGHATLDVSDEGFDITAYFAAARQYASQYRYFCFLNSFSVIQDREWLSKLYDQISQPGIGMVGATGSWHSHRGSGLPWLLVGMGVAAIRHYHLHRDKSIWKRLVLSATASCQHVPFILDIDPFPNYHLRTNAFMISSELINKIEIPAIKSKKDAYRFESGKNGLTQQILKLGKKILVVGKNGKGYEMLQWNKSRTFWQAEQENLLVSDNQTRDYQQGNVKRRKRLSSAAWGNYGNM